MASTNRGTTMTPSTSTTSSLTNFFTTHKRAILLTVAVAVTATSAYYYTSSPAHNRRGGGSSSSSSSSSTSGGAGKDGANAASEEAKKKKKKAKKSKSANVAGGTAGAAGGIGSSDNEKATNLSGEKNDEEPSEADIEIMDPEERSKLAVTLKARGNKLYSAKKYQEAIACYSKAIACEEQAVFYSNRAACYTNLNEQEKVIEDCTSALRLDPSYIKALNRRGTAREALGGVDELYQALCDFTAAAIIDNFQTEATQVSVERVMKKLANEKAALVMKSREPRLPSPTFIKAYLEAFRPQPDPEFPANPSQGDQTLKLAFEALHAKDFTHAFTYFHESLEQGISTNEGKAAALNMRATFRFIMSDAPAALKDLDEATMLSPKGTQSWVKKASVHMELGQPEEAFKDFDRALEIDSNNADVYYHRGQVYFITGEYDKAITEYRRSSEIDPSFIFSHIQLAVANYKNSAVEKAMHQFRKFLKEYPNSPEVFNYYGELLLDQQKYEEAVQNFETSIQLDKNTVPRNALPVVNKALAVFQWKQDFPEAEKICREALDIDEQCDVAVATLAQLLLQQNKVHDAVGMFARSAEMSRTEPELINALTYECATRAQIAFIQSYPAYAEKLGLDRSAASA